MTTIRTFIKRHAIPTYFVLAFAISWGGILLIVEPQGLLSGGSVTGELGPPVFLAMAAGPSVAGILMIAIVGGRTGIRDFSVRFLRWRVGARWYAVALLTTPLLATTILAVLALFSPDFLPGILATDDKAMLLVFGIAAGLGAGFFEEIGWTGVALPKVRLRHGVLAAGGGIGLLWGAWHFLVDLWAFFGSYGVLFVPYLLAFRVAALPAFRVLMVWIYDHTESLLVAQLMHASFTGSLLILAPPGVSAAETVLWFAIFAGALWAVVAIVAAVEGRQFVHGALQRRVV